MKLPEGHRRVFVVTLVVIVTAALLWFEKLKPENWDSVMVWVVVPYIISDMGEKGFKALEAANMLPAKLQRFFPMRLDPDLDTDATTPAAPPEPPSI